MYFKEVLKRNFIFCDIGARWGLEEPWESYRRIIDVICFEPDKEEFSRLSEEKLKNDIVLPFALSDKKKSSLLNLTKNKGCSSLYEPNESFLNQFPNVKRFKVQEKQVVELTTLDKLYKEKIIELDFLKIDVQGAELDILRGGFDVINEKAIGIQLEVEFKELYKSQPLFSEVDSYIREKHKLILFDIRKVFWKYNEGLNIGSSKGQLIWGDVLYFRDPYDFPNWLEKFSSEEATNKTIMACLMSQIYGYHDYALCVLNQKKLKKIIGKEINDILIKLVKKNAQNIKIYFKGSGRISEFFKLLSKVFEQNQPEPKRPGWAYSERHLGSKKKLNIFN